MRILKNSILLFIIISALVFPQKDKSEGGYTPVSVTVGGDFPLAGTYPAGVGERADQFLTRLITQLKAARISASVKLPAEVAQNESSDEGKDIIPMRGIVLKRRTGEKLILDLMRFRNEGDFSNNPQLQHEDVIIFPFYNYKTDYVEFAGAVQKPGKYQYVDGDNFKSLLVCAGGVNTAYPETKLFEVSRMSLDGRTITRDTFKLTDNPPLHKGDKVTLLGGEDLRGEFMVHLLGEFKEVKDINIPRGSISFTEIIKRGNGFTDYADLERVQVIKPSPYLAEYLMTQYGIDLKKSPASANRIFLDMIANREKFSFYRLSNMTELDTGYFFVEQRLSSLIDVRTYNLSRSGMELKNITAENGDYIVVPRKEENVFVMGQVRNAGRIKAAAGKDIEYYIQAAGGFTEFAKKDNIAIIKRDTKEWINPAKTKYTIEPGDYIFIHREEPRSFYYYFGLTSSYLNVIGGIATLTLLVLQFTK